MLLCIAENVNKLKIVTQKLDVQRASKLIPSLAPLEFSLLLFCDVLCIGSYILNAQS